MRMLQYIRHTFMIAAAMVAGSVVAHATTLVPAVGSVWESTLEYDVLPTEHSVGTIRRAKEVSKVVRLDAGRPVFAGEVFGYRGEIIESTQGTIVYTDDCKDKVDASMLIAPKLANQCVWHVCDPPAIGETFIRPMIFFVKLFSCEPQVATYSFVARRMALTNAGEVTVGDAMVYFSAFRQTSWTSHIRAGVGEVFAEARGRRSTYTRVDVAQIEYRAPTEVSEVSTPPISAKLDVIPASCDFVAFGDSLTEGMGASREDAYPAQLSKMFGKTVCNLGISGMTTETAMRRVSAVVALKPEVVFLTLGVNDAFQGVDPEVTAKNLVSIIDEFRKADAQVVFLGLQGVAAVLPRSVEPMLTASRSLENRQGVLLLPNAFVGVLDEKANMSSDGLHPNAKGYRRLCENIMNQALGILRVVPSSLVNQNSIYR